MAKKQKYDDVFLDDELDEENSRILNTQKESYNQKKNSVDENYFYANSKEKYDDSLETSTLDDPAYLAQFKCLSCGNNMRWNPEKQKLVCPYCKAEKEVEFHRVSECKYSENLNEEFNKEKFENSNDEVKIFRCENCGAVSEVPEGKISFTCPYCRKTNVIKQTQMSGIRPNGIIPFKVAKRKASKIANEWIKKRIYAPRALRKCRFDKELNGVYSPCWTFDTSTESQYRGRVGYVETRTDKDGHSRTTTRWRRVSGGITKSFDDLTIIASQSDMDLGFDKVTEFDTNNSFLYNKEFLAGFSAKHYDIEINDAWKTSQEIIFEDLEEEIKHRYNADRIDVDIKIDYYDTTYKYILLPYWLGSFTFNQKPYHLIINGSNGKIWGKYPKAIWKILLTIFGVAAIALIIYLIVTGNI